MHRTSQHPNQPEQPLLPATDYLRLMRHELRTPVNHMVGYSEILLEDLPPESQVLPYVATIQAHAQRILELIGAVFEDGAGDRDRFQQRLDSSGIPMVLAQIRAAAQQAHSTLDAEQRQSALTDLERIQRACEQLDQLILNGPQAEALAAGHESMPSSADGHMHNQLAGRMLVVEDNPENRDMLNRRLVKLGCTVVEADHGRRALELLHQQAFDVVLLDMMMPEMNGFDVLAAMKEDQQLRHIPVIMLSALDELASVARCIEMGADDYLPKPFDPLMLTARISAALEKKHLREQEQQLFRDVTAAKKRADDLLHVVIPLGVAFSSEKAYDRLLEKIVVEAMGLCNADGGSLYMRTDHDTLEFVILRNRSLKIAMGGASGVPIEFPALAMFDSNGQPDTRYVVTQAAHSHTSVLIADAYATEGFDFAGTRAFDARMGYRSTSLLAVPLIDTIGRVIGILQLLNAQDANGAIIAFDDGMRQMIESLSALATAALTIYEREQRLRDEIASMRIAIDQERRKREVAEITESDYFQNLRERAREMRAGGHPARPNQRIVDQETPPGDTESTDKLLGPLRERRHSKRIYQVGTQPIHVYEEGPPDGDIALLIHGWSSSWYAMSPLLPVLQRRYRCIAVDLPGYGDSPRLPQRTTIDGYVQILIALIEQLQEGQTNRRPIVLVGHSMGGMISIKFALERPDLVERLVLLCPTISGNLSTRINVIAKFTGLERYAFANRLVASLEPQLLSITDALMRPASFAERTGIQEREYHQLRADARRPGQGLVRSECFQAMRDSDLRNTLAGITTPALIIWGMEDNTVPLRDAGVVVDEWPAAELRVIPKAGHWPQFETPDFTIRAIRAFMSTPIKLLKIQF